MLFSLIFLVAHLSIKPYVRPEDDLLAVISQFMLVALFFGGILLKVFVDPPHHVPTTITRVRILTTPPRATTSLAGLR